MDAKSACCRAASCKRVLIEEGKKAAAEGRLAAALRKYETAMVTLPEVRREAGTLRGEERAAHGGSEKGRFVSTHDDVSEFRHFLQIVAVWMEANRKTPYPARWYYSRLCYSADLSQTATTKSAHI